MNTWLNDAHCADGYGLIYRTAEKTLQDVEALAYAFLYRHTIYWCWADLWNQE